MTHEEIIAMAREASSMERLPWNGEWIFRSKKELMAFASMAAAKEREECAQVCESRVTPGTGSVAILGGAADAIRARGQKEGA